MTLRPIITDFKLSLGGADPIVGQQLAVSGWYYDPLTGQNYYYDAAQNQWYYVSASGLLTALAAYMNTAPKQVTLAPGEKLRITLSFKYIGPAVAGVTGYYVIGVYGVGFAEQLVGKTTFSMPQVTTPPTAPNITDSYTFTIPTTIDPSWNDIYVKIFGGSPIIAGQATTPYIFGYTDALVIIGIVPTITEFMIKDFVEV